MTIDSYISILSNENDTLDNEDRNQIIEWLKELKIYKESNISVKNYEQGRADALNIDMEKPMHFTDEQKAWVKNYIIINAKRQRADAIDEFEKEMAYFCFGLKASQGNFCRVDVLESELKRVKQQLKEQNNDT